MDETSKTNKVRGAGFAAKYLQGKVLDIGCGKDIVCPGAQPFDQEHGDAQRISAFLPKESYDTVYSSHCLEHMPDPLGALAQWWSLVKPGGFLVTVVPHEDLYEQGVWPSRFNSDHKATFRLGGQTKFSPVSHDIQAIIAALPGANVVSVEVHDQGYDYSLMSNKDTVKNPRPLLPLKVARKLLRGISKPFPSLRIQLTHWIENLYFDRYGLPVDQTSRDALAQIQVIAQKQTGAV
jgi:SAM-dependent methyltransferase